jgi:hypothetical protein
MVDDMQRITRALVASCALAVPLTAGADGVGLMLEGGAYYAQVDDDIDFDFDDIEGIEDLEAAFDDKSYGYNLGIGWRFNKWLAVDGGYWDLGNFKSDDPIVTGSKAKIEFDTFTVGGMVSVPLWILDVYARGGAAFWNADSRNFDDDGTDPYYGVGASLNIGGSLDLYLEYLRFDLETAIDTFGLGARFTF